MNKKNGYDDYDYEKDYLAKDNYGIFDNLKDRTKLEYLIYMEKKLNQSFQTG